MHKQYRICVVFCSMDEQARRLARRAVFNDRAGNRAGAGERK
jgi:hypothetical protein